MINASFNEALALEIGPWQTPEWVNILTDVFFEFWITMGARFCMILPFLFCFTLFKNSLSHNFHPRSTNLLVLQLSATSDDVQEQVKIAPLSQNCGYTTFVIFACHDLLNTLLPQLDATRWGPKHQRKHANGLCVEMFLLLLSPRSRTIKLKSVFVVSLIEIWIIGMI